MSEIITAEQERLLRTPFTPAAIRIKPQTKPNAQGKSLVTFYIDARLAAERLNAVVGLGAWQDEYHVLSGDPRMGLPVECRLTINGVTKADVGQIDPSERVDDKAWKSAYSDALKRAAVKWGVGACLYALPNVWAEVKVVNGKAFGFTPSGQKAALDTYRRWLASDVNRWGEPLDHGDPDRAADDATNQDVGLPSPGLPAGVTEAPTAPEVYLGGEAEPAMATEEAINGFLSLAFALGADVHEKAEAAVDEKVANEGGVSAEWIARQTDRMVALKQKAA